MSRDIEKLRNIGIVAHIDAGKTTVTEQMLYFSGARHKAGRVDAGTTETDDDPEERERGITIYSACVTFPWKEITVNLLDTPGHVDFTAEVERCLRVLDGAVVVFSAREGVEAQSETVWRQANKYKVPRIIFINKMDREGAEFLRVYDQIKERLDARPVATHIPIGEGPAHSSKPFRGVIDLVSMKMLTFNPEDAGKTVETSDIAEEHLEEAHLWRSMMLESLYNFSNEMMELALEEEPIPEELIYKVLREATIEMQIQPLLCGSALHGKGVQPLLDAVAAYLPSPLDKPPVEGVDPQKKDKKLLRKPSPKEPFCGLVFKILPFKTGDWYWVRVYSGELKANSRVYNPAKDLKENVAQLWRVQATRRDREGQVPSVSTGDIVGVIGPRHSITGDTLCDAKHPVLLESIAFPETVLSMSIEPETTTERKKLADTLDMLERQDPTFDAIENEDTGQTIISGMGELHLEVIKHKLLRDYNLDVKVHKPRVSYKETVSHAAEVVGECNRLQAGQQLFAKLKIRLEPAEEGEKGVQVRNEAPPDSLPSECLEAALDELRSAGQGGGEIGGFPLTKIRITVLGGETADAGSTDVAFRIAANDAFHRALNEAGPVLLEPIMKLDITTPEEYMGEFVSDLQRRRGIIAKSDIRGETAAIVAHAPLEQLFGYSGAMRSLSQGRAACSIEPYRYAPAPPEVAERFAM